MSIRRYCNLKYIGLSILLLFSVAVSSLSHLGSAGSYSILRKPRLELKQATAGIGPTLHFYNLDTLSTSESVESAVECTLTGGHLENTTKGWRPVTSVDLICAKEMEVWQAPNGIGALKNTKLQTRTSCNITYRSEGKLTCRDTMGLRLITDTILLRFKNAESVLVRLRSNLPIEEMWNLVKDYSNYSYMKQIGRVLDFESGEESKLLLRVSIYDSNLREFDQSKVVKDVKELTDFICDKRKASVDYVWSTRYCLPVNEGDFSWMLTKGGRMSLPENPCMDQDDNPMPQRRCVGDFFEGVRWDTLPRKPHLCLDPKQRSTHLRNITNSLNKNFLESLKNEVINGSALSAVEVYFVSEALKKTADGVSQPNSEVLIPTTLTVASIVNSILQAGKDVVKLADESYGSSSTILASTIKLIVASASPNPVPVSLEHFSAFASTAGTGIRGFAYLPSDRSANGLGRMITFDKTNTIFNVVKLNPNVIAYLDDEEEDFGIISTFFKDSSLFSAATIPNTTLQGPVFGMKFFQRRNESMGTQKPTILTIRYVFDEEKPSGLRCVSWEPSRDGGWSSAGCRVLDPRKTSITCVCTLVTSFDAFFTVLLDKNKATGIDKLPSLNLLPLRNNVGSLLHIYETRRSNLEKNVSCSVDLNYPKSEPQKSLSLEKLGRFAYGLAQKMIVYNVSYNGEGQLQCTSGKVVSEKSTILLPNTAILTLLVQSLLNSEVIIYNYLSEHNLDYKFSKIKSDNRTGEEVYRVSQYSENDHLNFIKTLRDIFRDLEAQNGISLEDIQSNRLCLKHEEGGFMWPNARPGYLATPINPCIDSQGASIPRRRCLGDHVNGVYWDKVPERPDPCIGPSKRTQRFQELTTNTVKKDIFDELLETIEGGPVLSVVEINILSEALKNAAEDSSLLDPETPKPNITTIAMMVNAVLEAELDVTGDVEATVSSEELLYSIDRLVVEASSEEPTPVTTTHFTAVSVSPGNKYRGFLEISNNNNSTKNEIKPLTWNDTDEAMAMPVKTGAILLEAPDEVGVAYTTFKDDKLFIGATTEEGSQVASPVVGMKMFGKDGEDLSDIPNLTVLILFSKNDSAGGSQRSCHYLDTKTNKWSSDGCTRVAPCDLPDEIPSDVDACMCTHLTHFAMLISSVQHEDEDLLHLFTIVGCSTSLICLIGIFLFAAFSPEMRKGASKKVQLNLSAALTILMASYLFVAFLGECPYSIGSCIAHGAILHYSVLASFSWMFVAAVLQLLKLTPGVSMDARRRAGTHLILKASIIGWGLPLLLVSITLGTGTDNYARRPNSALCYPIDRAFYISVLFPVSLITTMNTIVFIWLTKMMFCTKVKDMRVHQRAKRQQAMRRIFSSMFLFCLLGITWLSGVMIEVTVTSEWLSKVISYLFCVTASLQGACLFIFFVACERKVRKTVFEAVLSFSRKATIRGSSNGYTNKFENSESDKTTLNVELSRTGSNKGNPLLK